jgi:6-pyruvoyltetrahydropterin/6-carboxytetrahydropterin synthase
MFELMVEETFDAAHALRGYEGPCENLHGHTWKVQVFIQGAKLNKLGLLADFKVFKKELGQCLKAFDHQHLNEVAPFVTKNPTSEHLAEFVYKTLRKTIKNISKVTIWESTTTNASYY